VLPASVLVVALPPLEVVLPLEVVSLPLEVPPLPPVFAPAVEVELDVVVSLLLSPLLLPLPVVAVLSALLFVVLFAVPFMLASFVRSVLPQARVSSSRHDDPSCRMEFMVRLILGEPRWSPQRSFSPNPAKCTSVERGEVGFNIPAERVVRADQRSLAGIYGVLAASLAMSALAMRGRA